MATVITGIPIARSRLKAYTEATKRAVREGMRAGAERIESWEKRNHRWVNRTGEAERQLTCLVVDNGSTIQLVNTNFAVNPKTNFPYPVVLEFGHGERYAILRDALRRYWLNILSDIARRQRVLAR